MNNMEFLHELKPQYDSAKKLTFTETEKEKYC